MKKAFTLAEVLITLGIIGIVAAMTIPSLVASHKEKARITALKKIYSQLQNAFNLAVYEYGPLANWDLSATNTGKKNNDGEYILDYSGRDKFLANISPYLSKSNITEVKYDGKFSLDGRSRGESPSIKVADGKNAVLITKDGYLLSMGWISTGGTAGDIWITLPNEKKSIIGVTTFHFIINEKGFIPNGLSQSSFEAQCDVKNKSIATDYNGRTCTAWALMKENMEYLRCNDLSWDGKQKCN